MSQRSDGTTITVRLQRYAIVADRYRNPVVLGELMFGEEGEQAMNGKIMVPALLVVLLTLLLAACGGG